VVGLEHLRRLTGYTRITGATTDTHLFERAKFPVGFLMKNCAPLFRLLQVAHKLEAGAKRYVDLLSDDSFARKFPNGGNPMSGMSSVSRSLLRV
jgi:hypothetical protein